MARSSSPPHSPDQAAQRLLEAVEGIHDELVRLRQEIQTQRAMIARGQVRGSGEKLIDLAREILARAGRRV